MAARPPRRPQIVPPPLPKGESSLDQRILVKDRIGRLRLKRVLSCPQTFFLGWKPFMGVGLPNGLSDSMVKTLLDGRPSISNIEKAISRLLILPLSYISRHMPTMAAMLLTTCLFSFWKSYLELLDGQGTLQLSMTRDKGRFEREPSNIRHWTKLFFSLL